MSRILVIDDDSGHRLVLKSRLTESGHEVVLIETGAQGIAEARVHPYDAFLVATRLGKGVDGYEVCRRLKAIPERAHVPVILFNDGAALPDEPTRAFEAGADAHVTKPDLPALDLVLRVHLRSKRRLEELSREVTALHEHARKLALHEPRAQAADGEHAPRDMNGDHSAVLREIAAGKPDGLVLVDSEGTVRFADRGASELLGGRLEGMHLGNLAPSSGLEAFARDARIEPREGFRFDLPARKGRMPRSVHAVVIPLLVQPTPELNALRVVIFQDAGKRRLAAELLKLPEPSIPRAELGALVEAAREVFRPESLVGVSTATQALRADVTAAARHDEPVLLRGDRSSGLVRVARILHFSGSSTGAFIHVRCSSQSPEILELELFGCIKGSTPRAQHDRPGAFQLAQDGTLFLEDIGELPPELQARVQRFLESGSVQRKGAQRPERIDLRLIASTNEPLENAVSDGRFSRELFGRLSAHMLRVLPLTQRREDIEPLARQLLARFGAQRRVSAIDADVFELLRRHDWPGSVSELEDAIESACALATDGVVQLEHLPRPLRDARARFPADELIPTRRAPARSLEGTHAVSDLASHEIVPRGAAPVQRPTFVPESTNGEPVSLDSYEKKALQRAIEETGGDKLAAAKLLGVGKSTLYRKLKYHGIH